MIPLAELASGLEGATLAGAHQLECRCPKCGGKATIRDFGARRSFRCEHCGTLEERDFRNRLAAVVQTQPHSHEPAPERNDHDADPSSFSRTVNHLRNDEPSALLSEADAHSLESPNHSTPQPRPPETLHNQASAVPRRQSAHLSRPLLESSTTPAADIQNASAVVGDNKSRNNISRDGADGQSQSVSDNGHRGWPRGTYLSNTRVTQQRQGIHAADDILKRVPPQNLEAEQSVLGAVLLDNESISKALQIVQLDSFYRETHREIFRGMVNLRADNVPVDAITLCAELRKRGVLEAIGGAAYIAELANCVPTAANIGYYAQIVRDMALKRHIASQATMLASLAYDGVTADALIGEMERLLKPITEDSQRVVPFPEPLTASQWYAREEQLYSRVTWVWDNILEGGGISVLAGKKGAGKSTFVRTLMLAAARGWALLGRNMQASRIWYIDMEPGGSARKALMEQLGWNDDDQLHISTGSPMAGKPGLFEWLKAKIVANRYQMVVVDTMYKLLKIEGTNDYDKGIYGQVPIEEICRETGCHFMLIHHARKNPSPGALSSIAEEILGSVSVAATAGTVMLIRKRMDVGTFQMDPPRYGEAIEGEIVLKKLENGWVEGAGSYGNQWVGWAKQAVLAAISERGKDWSKAEDIEVIDVAKGGPMTVKSKKWLLGKLVDSKEIERTGEGVRGDPFRYRKATLVVSEPDPRYKDN